MPTFMLAYHRGPDFGGPKDGGDHMARYRAWQEGLGDAIVGPDTPLGPSKTVTSAGVEDGGGPNPIMGFMLLRADSLDVALALTRPCPFLEMGGTIEVAETMAMPGNSGSDTGER